MKVLAIILVVSYLMFMLWQAIIDCQASKFYQDPEQRYKDYK